MEGANITETISTTYSAKRLMCYCEVLVKLWQSFDGTRLLFLLLRRVTQRITEFRRGL